MNLIYVIVGCVVLSIMWFVPVISASLILKKIIGKKIAKGWCVLIAVIMFFICSAVEVAIIGIHDNYGFIDMAIRLGALSTVFIVLYDKNIPSIFDSEKELKRKRKLQQDQINTNVE